MALVWSDLTLKEKATALATAESARAQAVKHGVIDAAKAALDAEQAAYRIDAAGMSKSAYLAIRASRDATVKALADAWIAAQQGA